VQLAILGSSEAEKKGLSQEMGQAFMALAEAHRDQGDLENAIGASTRASMVSGNLHNKQRVPTPCCSWPICMSPPDIPRRPWNTWRKPADSTAAQKMDRAKFIRLQTKAKSHGAAGRRPGGLLHGRAVPRWQRSEATDKPCWTCFPLWPPPRPPPSLNQDALNTENDVLKLAVALDKPTEAAVSSNNVGELNLRLGRNDAALQAFGKGLIMVEDVPYLRLSMLINAANAQAIAGNHRPGPHAPSRMPSAWPAKGNSAK
jgi:hypothetical protein